MAQTQTQAQKKPAPKNGAAKPPASATATAKGRKPAAKDDKPKKELTPEQRKAAAVQAALMRCRNPKIALATIEAVHKRSLGRQRWSEMGRGGLDVGQAYELFLAEAREKLGAIAANMKPGRRGGGGPSLTVGCKVRIRPFAEKTHPYLKGVTATVVWLEPDGGPKCRLRLDTGDHESIGIRQIQVIELADGTKIADVEASAATQSNAEDAEFATEDADDEN